MAERLDIARDAEIAALFAMPPVALNAYVDARVPASQAGTRQLLKIILRMLIAVARKEFTGISKP